MVNRVMSVSERRYLKEIPPCSAVVKYLGFAPQSPLESGNGVLKPKYLTTFI